MNTTSRRYKKSYSNRRRRKEEAAKTGRILGTMFYFPVLFIFLELIFHIYMGMELKYFPIYLLFGISAGCLFSIFIMNFGRRANGIICKVLTVLLCLIYGAEIMCKKILQTYYQLFSTAGTALNNNLTDYKDAVFQAIAENWFIVLILLLPIVFIFVFGNRLLSFKRKRLPLTGIMLALTVMFHLFGLGSLYLPWNGDLTPSQLYHSDTNVEDQVEQLGLWTMLRLDVKHSIVKPENNLGDDFSNLNIGTNFQPSESESEAPAGTDPSQSPDETLPQETEPVIDTSPNIMDVDLQQIADTAENEDIQWLANYFNSVAPTNKNEYTGMFEGYNLIFMSLEGFSQYAIDPERTPTLYKMANEGFVFENFYTPLHFTSTSGGECQNLTGLYPKNGNPITLSEIGDKGTNIYFSLAHQLAREGYLTMGFHMNEDMYNRQKSHTVLGYDMQQQGTGLEMELSAAGNKIWPQSDLYLMEQTVDKYINSEQPFHIYYMTLSGHMPYNFNGHQMSMRNQELVADLPYSETTKAYLAAQMEVEKALTYLIDRLDQAGKLDNTLFVMCADHIPYFDIASMEELAGVTFGDSAALEYLKEDEVNFDVYKNTLFIWSASMEEPVKVDKICTQTDILPTVSNLMGLEYDSRMLPGTDIMSDSSPLVIFSSQCWLTDMGLYNRYTKTFTPAEGVTMTQEEQDAYVENMKKIVRYRLGCTEKILDTNFYEYVFGDQ